MIWALLYYYLFGSGNQGLVMDVAKPVKAQVQDEAKAKQIIELNKAMLKAEAELGKQQKEAGKELAKLNKDRQASEAAFLAIHAALDHGINWIDTADIYGQGRAEQIVGGGRFRFDHRRPDAGRQRQSVLQDEGTNDRCAVASRLRAHRTAELIARTRTRAALEPSEPWS